MVYGPAVSPKSKSLPCFKREWMCVCQTFSFCFFLLFFSFSSTFYFLVSTLSLSFFRCLNLYFDCLNLYDVWTWTVNPARQSLSCYKLDPLKWTRETRHLGQGKRQNFLLLWTVILYTHAANIAWEFGFNLLFIYLFILRVWFFFNKWDKYNQKCAHKREFIVKFIHSHLITRDLNYKSTFIIEVTLLLLRRCQDLNFQYKIFFIMKLIPLSMKFLTKSYRFAFSCFYNL